MEIRWSVSHRKNELGYLLVCIKCVVGLGMGCIYVEKYGIKNVIKV